MHMYKKKIKCDKITAYVQTLSALCKCVQITIMC